MKSPSKLVFTRDDLLVKSKSRPLHKIRWQDIKGTMRAFSVADVVIVHDQGKAAIMKDRQGDYLHLERDANRLVNLSDINAIRPLA